MNLNNNQLAFIALVQAGLWESDISLSSYGEIDFDEVYRLAVEQSVVGIVAAGLEHIIDIKTPQRIALLFAGAALQLEKRNHAMNSFIAELFLILEKAKINAMLVKGQGIAQCYERPLWRSAGDIDLLVKKDDYLMTVQYLSSLSSKNFDEDAYCLHKPMIVDSWEVEIHGSLRSRLWKEIDCEIDVAQSDSFKNESDRVWKNSSVNIVLPDYNNDVLFIFSHILQHFFKGGIGLRQICDWCRLLYRNCDKQDLQLLEQRLRRMGIVTEWKAFASLIVNHLGMPVEAIPFYSSEEKWNRKSKKILDFIIETGNFGQNRDYSFYKKFPYLIYKTISLWRHTKDSFRYFFIFPKDSIKVWRSKLQFGMRFALLGK